MSKATKKQAAPKSAAKKAASKKTAAPKGGDAAPSAASDAAPDTAAPAASAAKKPRASSNVATALRPDERKALEAYAENKGRSVSSILRESALKAAGFKYVARSPGRPPKAD